MKWKYLLLALWSVSFMLNIGANARAAFLSDSAKKQLNIEIEGKTIEEYNPYRGHISMFGRNINVTQGNRWYIKFNTEPDSDNASLWFDWSYVPTRRYVCVYLNIMFDDVVTAPDQITVRCYYTKSTGGDSHYVDKTFNASEFSDYKQVAFIFDTLEYPEFTNVSGMAIRNAESTPLECTILYHGIQLDYSNVLTDLPMPHKDGIGDQTIKVIPEKRYTNEDIALESFELTESLCSQDNIKFGLCESASVKFDLVNKDYRVKGLTIRPSISCMLDEDYTKVNWAQGADPEEHSDTWVNANMSTGHWKSDEYNFYHTKEKENGRIPQEWNWYAVSFDLKIDNLEMAEGSTAPSLMRIGVRLRKNNDTYISYYTDNGNSYYSVDELLNGVHVVIYLRDIDSNYKEIDGTYFRYYGPNREAITGTISQIDFTWSNVQINALKSAESEIPRFNIGNAYAYNDTLEEYFDSFSIPLGVYEITDVQTERTLNTVVKHITAYDKLLKLEQNAADWYTSYMYGFDTIDSPTGEPSRHDIMWARQIYSSFFNFAKSIGIDSRDNYTEEIVLPTTQLMEDFTRPYITNMYSIWTSDPIPPSSKDNASKLHYSKITVNSPDVSKRYVVDVTYNETYRYEEYITQCDLLGRGLFTANILVKEIRSGDFNNTFLVNSGDYFMLSPDTTSIEVYVPTCDYVVKGGFDSGLICDTITISKVTGNIKLANGSTHLMYYDWWSKDIFACESNITGRDVVRSLLEPCGCFFRLSRDKGIPQFVYCTKSGLYPANNLYPADDLYPRSGVDGENIPISRYMRAIFDDYTVKDYGRIQILKKIETNESKSVVEWEYSGDPDKENTYIFTDNIFYCNKDMYYEQDSMYEVSEMLENMYMEISNMGYVPNITTALGMPWLECGDRIGLITLHSGSESFLFRRNLKGIQMLKDTYESSGDEKTEAIKEYGYINNGG